jgi:hypothetical protein
LLEAKMRLALKLFLLTLLLAACAPLAPASPPDEGVVTSPPHRGVISSTEQPETPPDLPPLYLPRAGDENLERSEVYLESVDLVAMTSEPPQFSLLIKGNLPTPCHQLRVVSHEADAQNRIMLEVYSLANPQAVCVQMLQPFEQSIQLGSFPAGHYTVWINGKQVAEFDG